MEYFVLIATLLSLFSGLLFYVDALPGKSFPNELKFLLIATTMIIVIGSNILVMGMFFFDILIRRKKDKKNIRKLRQELKQRLENESEEKGEEKEYNYNEEIKEQSSDEDGTNSMNQIILDIFSLNRLKKNVANLDSKRKEIQQKVTTKVVQVTNTQVDLDGDHDVSDFDYGNLAKKFGLFQRGSKDIDVTEDDLMSKINQTLGVSNEDNTKRHSIFVSLGKNKKKNEFPQRNSKDINLTNEKSDTGIEEVLETTVVDENKYENQLENMLLSKK